jgi:hypothetical protein
MDTDTTSPAAYRPKLPPGFLAEARKAGAKLDPPITAHAWIVKVIRDALTREAESSRQRSER